MTRAGDERDSSRSAFSVAIHARGIAFVGGVHFVRETYGPPAHERVLAALPQARRASFVAPIREASWQPLGNLAAYVDAARARFAPEEAAFYRRVGRFIGTTEREKGGFKPMVAQPSTAMRLAPMLWSTLYDSGRVESIIEGAREGRLRIHGFRTTRQLCEANCGGIEGLAGTQEIAVTVEHTACVLDGSPCCEFHVVWQGA